MVVYYKMLYNIIASSVLIQQDTLKADALSTITIHIRTNSLHIQRVTNVQVSNDGTTAGHGVGIGAVCSQTHEHGTAAQCHMHVNGSTKIKLRHQLNVVGAIRGYSDCISTGTVRQ